MKGFQFRSSLPASKSILNRALIIQSHFHKLEIIGDSACDDVTYMKQGLRSLEQNKNIDCGEGGTTLRFLTLRASRFEGNFFLQAHPRLMSRPQQELVEILKALGVRANLEKNGIQVHSSGWQKSRQPIQVGIGDSSQYASSLLLNAWNLDFDLEFALAGPKLSESYFTMTLEMVQKLGMTVIRDGDRFAIPAKQLLQSSSYYAEPDLSSAFVFAAAGALFGRCEILKFPKNSLQPDRAFIEAFHKMNIHCDLSGDSLTTSQATVIKSLEFNLSQSPDLFPVLAVLCSFAHGTSRLYGAPHLAFKETNRIKKVADLFDLIGVRYELQADGMIIHGNSNSTCAKKMTYDTGHDHRMVMAAALFKRAGHNLTILYPESVSKSLPEFFDLFEEKP